MNNTQQVDAILLSCLLDIRRAVDNQFEGLAVEDGICVNVTHLRRQKTNQWMLGSDYHARMSELFTLWPECSDIYGYPVPSPTEKMDAHDIYYEASNMWIGEYGAARIRLLDFMIEQLQEAGDE